MLIELVTYQTTQETTQNQHLTSVDSAHQAVIGPLGGCLGRVLCGPNEQSKWMDMVLWQDQHRFEQASRQVMENPACREWLSSIAKDSIVMQTADLLPGYEAGTLRLEDAGCWLVVTWFTQPGVDQEEHQALNREIQVELMPAQDGFISVATAQHTQSGQYFEIVAFRDHASAETGLEAITAACSTHPRFQKHLHDCDPERVTTQFLQPSQRWAKPAHV